MRFLALAAAALALSACLPVPPQEAVDAARTLGVDRYCVTSPVPFCVTLGGAQ